MYHKVFKLWLLCFIGFFSYGQGNFQNFPKPDSVECNSIDLVSRATAWYNTFGGGTINANLSNFSIRADKNLNTFLSDLRLLQSRVCDKDRKVYIVFSIFNSSGIKTDSSRVYFKINDDGIRVIRNPELNKRDTCFEGVEPRLIAWLNSGGNGQVGTFCSGSVAWTDFLYNGSDGSSGSGKINVGPYPRIPSNACGWTLNVTFFAQDSCGNRRGFPGRYIIIDNQPPVLNQSLADLTVACHQIPDTIIRVKDACDRLPSVFFKSTSTKGTNPNLCSFYNYTINREWLVIDRCGNRDTFYQKIRVSDQQPPVITLQNDITITCADTSNLNVLISGISDNCTRSAIISYRDSIIQSACVDIRYRKYFAEDLCKNISITQQKVYVSKSQVPIVSRIPDVLSLSCGQNFEKNYKEWLENRGGLKIDGGCSEVRFNYGSKVNFSINNKSTWKNEPPPLSEVLNEKSDTAFFIIAFTDCGRSLSIPVLKTKTRNLSLRNQINEFCSNDTIKLRVDGVSSGDTIVWREKIGSITKEVFSSKFGELIYKVSNPNAKILVQIKGNGCSDLYRDSVVISELFKKPSLIKLKDISLCEGENLILNYTDTTKFDAFTWVAPDGKLISGKKVVLSEKSTETLSGIYKYVARTGLCVSDTFSLLVKVHKKPSIKVGQNLYETCGDNKLTIKIMPLDFDTILWYRGREIVRKSIFDTLILNPGPTSEGTYFVFAQKSGCLSDSTERIVVKVGTNLTPDFKADISKCEGDSIFLNPSNKYEFIQWVLPSQDTVKEQNPKIKAISGQYKMIIKSKDGCQGEVISNLIFKTKPVIVAITSDYSKCDTLSNITLKPSLNKIDTTLKYKWILPDQSVSNTDKLTIPRNRFLFGNYALVVSNGSCFSDTFKTIVAQDSAIRNIELKAPVFYCDLDTVSLDAGLGYSFYKFIMNGLTISEGSSPNFKFVPGRTDTLKIKVEGFNKNCLEGQSDVITLLPGVKPSKPVISKGVFDICLADSLRLNVSNPDPDFDYIWLLPTGANKQGQALRIIDLPNNLEGTYRVRAIRGTCISELSDSVRITVKPKIDVPDFAQFIPPICDDGNVGIKVCLTNIPKDTSLRFNILQLPSQKVFYQGRDTCIEIKGGSFEQGTKKFRLRSVKGDCFSDEFKDMNVNITARPDIKANILTDALAICQGVDSIRLFNEKPIDTLQVIWRVFSQATLNTLPNNEISLSNLSSGVNRVILTISYLNCRNYSSDTLDLLVGLQPKVKDSLVTSNVNEDVLIPLLNYDSIGTYYFIEFDKTSKGEIITKGGKYFLRPNRFFTGKDTVTYTLCFGKCKNECKKAKAIINYTQKINCDLPNIITPNGDGINDAFILPCLASKEWQSVDFLLFDQWGNQVYKNQNYQNDFEGISAGKLLPADTYYYIVKPSSSEERFTGFLIIKY